MDSGPVAIPTPALAERSPLREMMIIAAPAVASMMSFSIMQFVDRWMCSRLVGPEAMGAVGNGGMASWIPGAVMMGTLGVINTYVSQNLGAGKPERGAVYAWAGVWISMVAYLVALVPYAIFFPHAFEFMRGTLGLQPVSDHLHSIETLYGRILVLGMCITLAARAIGHWFYGMHKPYVVMFSTIAGNLVNLVVSYALIKLAMGRDDLPLESREFYAVGGAAVGTVIGLAVELAIPLWLFLSKSYHQKYATRTSWKPAIKPALDILRIGWPGGVMFGNEMVCWWIFMSGYVATFDAGSDAPVHTPAGQITHQYLMLSFMPAVGISIATTAIVGRCIGAGRTDLAEARAWLGVRITMIYMGLCALCFVFFGPSMVRLWIPGDVTAEQAQEIVRLGTWMLICAATFQLFDGLAITISGALRGAGDTVWPGVYTVVLSWGLIVGGGRLAIEYLPQLSSFGPWIAASLYIIALSLALLARFRSGKWKLIKVIDRAGKSEAEGGAPALASNTGPGPIGVAPGLDIPQDDSRLS
jgi:multidrug resistance protein, MATE family